MTKQQVKIKYAEVVFPVPVDHSFTYLISEKFVEDVVPGIRVLVPFGPRKTTGFVVNIKDSTDIEELKAIEEVLDPVPLFTQEVLRLAQWISHYYLCGWGEVLKAALPSGIHRQSTKIARLIHGEPERLAQLLEKRAPRQAQIVSLLAQNNPLQLKKLARQMNAINIHSSLRRLCDAGFVRLELELPRPKVGKKYDFIVELCSEYSYDELNALADKVRTEAPKQAQVIEVLRDAPEEEFTRAELARRAGVRGDVLMSLKDRGIINLKKVEIYRDYYASERYDPPPRLTLNPDQQASLDVLKSGVDASEFSPFLLHGVTCSGKTQVYIETIAYAIEKGKTAIVLVPEIALTPQMVRRFRSYFGQKVAVFHSRMSPGERYDSWRGTWEGKHQIVIGPRSAIYAPLANVGLIIIDEEHEPSYKQVDLTPRYHARDVAVMRAKYNNAVIVLGSATPSLETFFNVKIKKYKLLELPKRIDDIPMPAIHIVDMRCEPKIIGRKDPIIFSRLLRQKIDEKLAKGEQVILFQNRRGFATLLKCRSCGYIAECQNCSITLTYHLRGHFLRCHYCGYTRRAPDHCPECDGIDIFLRGVGTQRIEEELKLLFPGVRFTRMDLDTTRGKWAHDKILSDFGKGTFDILLGTQMVAKGLDFPRVTLVGVISADTELFFPDFRAGERTFQLLTQVAGRAGRKDKIGEVVIQTLSPDHYSLFYVKTHDYASFYQSETNDRIELAYPPFSRLINILFRGPLESSVQKTAEKFSQYLDQNSTFKILGPSPAILAKIEGNYRYQILLMSSKQSDASGSLMKEALRTALKKYRQKHRARQVKISIDVDPVSIL